MTDEYDIFDCWTPCRATEDDLKRNEEEEAFLDLLRLDQFDERRENLRRQESRNISLRARGDNHYRKAHCGRIKARKGWR